MISFRVRKIVKLPRNNTEGPPVVGTYVLSDVWRQPEPRAEGSDMSGVETYSSTRKSPLKIRYNGVPVCDFLRSSEQLWMISTAHAREYVTVCQVKMNSYPTVPCRILPEGH